MKIAIIGAGALGLLYGGLLSYQNEVHLIDVVKDKVDLINEKGVTIYDEEYKSKVTYYPKAHLSGTFNENVDLVMVLVKSNYTKSSLEINRALFKENTYVLTLQNGLGNDEKILPYISKERLILGVTRINSALLSNNEIKRVNHGVTALGYNKQNREFIKLLELTFHSCTLDVGVTDNIEELVWSKLFLNLAVNPYCAYYNMSMSELLKDEEKWNHMKGTITEAVNVANALGQKFDVNTIINTNYEFIKKVNGFPSMYQDIKAKRVTEINAMNGMVATLGKRLNIDVKENEWITNKIHEIESTFKSK